MYKYTLEETDHVQQHLYMASISPMLVKQRKRIGMLLTYGFLIAGAVFILLKVIAIGVAYLIAGALFGLFWPGYQAKRFQTHIKKYLFEQYQFRYGLEQSIQFNQDSIVTITKYSESKVLYTSWDEIHEIETHILIKQITDDWHIIPKHIKDYDKFKTELKEVASRLAITWNENLGWKWK